MFAERGSGAAAVSRAVWIRRRAANVRRRSNVVGGVACIAFAMLLAILIAGSPGVWRARRAPTMPSTPRPDTLALTRAVGDAAARAQAAASAIVHARAAAERLAHPPLPIDTFPAPVRARRDSLQRQLAELGRLLQGAESAPLPASYRALGTAPEMQGDAHVAQLLDSLTAIEQTRAAFDAVGGVDPVFVALTARAADLGKEIQKIALARYDALRVALGAVTPVAPRIAPIVVPDTVALFTERDSAVAAHTAALERLAHARIVSRQLDDEAAQERERAAMGVPPTALLGAAAVLALAIGFAVALTLELRRPCIADVREAEEITGQRVLVVVRPHRPLPERMRRQADREMPPLVHPVSDTYQVLYTQLADSAFNLPLVAVIGDRSLATAVVAANLAATAARQPRATLLVDTDFAAHSVSAVAHVASAPGLADVLDQRIEWPETIAAMIAARDRTVDILPSGVAFTGSRALDDGAVAALRRELARLGRRYETVIVNIPASRDGTAPAAAGVDMAVVCACVGRTRLATLAELVERVAAGGTTIRGLVLWEMADPARPAPGAVRSRAVTPTASPATLAT